jgi:hypothetical protein
MSSRAGITARPGSIRRLNNWQLFGPFVSRDVIQPNRRRALTAASSLP